MDGERALALMGFMGAGKSTVGPLVAERVGAPYRDLDEAIEARCGMSIPAFFEANGEAAFRELEAEILPTLLTPGSVVSLGGGAPMDDRNWSLVSGGAVTVWLKVPLGELLDRAKAERGTRPMLAGRTPGEVETLYEARCRRYAQAEHVVDATGEPARIAEEVVRLWRR